MCASQARKTEPSTPTLPTIKRLFALSGNVCAFPRCPNTLVDDASGKVTGRVCHIKGRKPGAARYDPNQTAMERHGFDNLILMCPIHHDVIDDNPAKYTVAVLRKYKAEHEKAHKGRQPPSDDIAKQFQATTFDTVFQSRNNLRQLQAAAQAMGALANIDDPYWTRTFRSDGALSITANSPDAHELRPLTVNVQTRVQALEDPSVADRLKHAVETQEAVTIHGAELVSFKTFLGDTLVEDLQNLLQHVTVTISVAPLGPIMDCSLRVQGTGAELRRLKLGLYALSGNRLRLTNRQDDQAHVIVSIDFPWSWDQSVSADEVIELDDKLSITIESRPVPTRNVRQVLELYEVLRSLQEPRTVEIYDNDTSEVRFISLGAHIGNLIPDEEAFIDALQAVQDAFPMVTFPIPRPIEREQVRKVFEVAEIVRTGQQTIVPSSFSAEMGAETLTNILAYADTDGVIGRARGNDPKYNMSVRMGRTEHEVFGVTLDIGPSQQDLCPVKLVPSPRTLRGRIARLAPGATIPVRLVPAEPSENRVVCHYSRYTKETPA